MRGLLLILSLVTVGCSGGAGSRDAGFDPDADIYPPDLRVQADQDPDPCVGADGGTDGSADGARDGSADGDVDVCTPGPVDCARGDCVHGECVDVPGGADWCDCFEGYAGELCDRCDGGYVALGLECVPAGGCSDNPCVHGTCRPGAGGDFTCDCHEGYAGALCDRCDEGYHVEDLRCVAD